MVCDFFIYICVCVRLSVFIETNTCAEVRVERICQCCWLCEHEQLFWNGGFKKQTNKKAENSTSVAAQRRTSVCLPFTPFLPWCPSAVTYGTERQLGKVVSTDTLKACGQSAESRTSVSFTPKQVKGRVLWMPLFQKWLFQANAGEGNCVVVCWGSWVGHKGRTR